ncbi:MAG: radical SAM protein [Candidatus Moraniibacteriota bacterium]
MKSLEDLYRIPGLYSSPNMFSPPSERLDHVIQFELTKGCSWGKCTFCGGYCGIKYSIKTPEEYKQHVDNIWRLIGEKYFSRKLKRIFVGGGNSLNIDGEMLHQLLLYTQIEFSKNIGRTPNRVALYGRTTDILKHGKDGMANLCHGGRWRKGKKWYVRSKYFPAVLDLIYWGVESGSDDVLRYVQKGCTSRNMIDAATILRTVNMNTSVMIMPGLGGIKHYIEHVERTAELLGVIRPRFLTFMGVNAGIQSLYAQKMRQEEEGGINRPLTQKETAEQMIEIIEKMPFFETKIGCFNTDVDAVGCNYLPFGSYNISDRGGKNSLSSQLRYALK